MIKITPLTNGPFLIEADTIHVHIDANSHDYRTEKVTLCRCGRSENQPYCDGKHSIKTVEEQSSLK